MGHKILCCSGSLEGGGSERQLWQLACHLRRPSFQPHVYLHYRSGQYLEQLPSDCSVHSFWDSPTAGKNTWLHRIPGTIHRKQVAHLRGLLEAESFDLVYDRTFHMTLVTAQACALAGVPRVSVVVSPPSRDFSQSRERFAAVKRKRLAAAYSDSRSRTLAVSEAVALDASEYYSLDRDSIQVVSSPVDIDAVQRMAKSFQAFPDGSRNIVVVGRLSKEKGQGTAIEGFESCGGAMPGYTLHFIGDGPDREHLQRLAETGKGQYRFHGHQQNPYPFIEQADLVLIPSRYEGLPNIALEAMALSTPVLSTRCSASVEELLADNRGILTNNDTAASINEGLENFDRMPAAELTGMAERALAYIVDNHCVSRWIAEMENIFSNQIAAHDAKVRK